MTDVRRGRPRGLLVATGAAVLLVLAMCAYALDRLRRSRAPDDYEARTGVYFDPHGFIGVMSMGLLLVGVPLLVTFVGLFVWLWRRRA